jgi:LuxR family transcriptional regulator, maltose regulon positive regulatory protein
MARRIPYVAAGVLHRPDHPDLPAVALDTPAWWSWLDAPTTRSFAFHDPAGTFTARKEQRQRGGAYWTAYRRVSGKLLSAYLGKSAALTRERLTAAAARLARRSDVATAQDPSVSLSVSTPHPVPTLAAPLLATKLAGPAVRPKLVPRPHLIARLTAGLTAPLTLVAAGAGFGKTTSLALWLQQTGRATAWVTLDAGDNDPGRWLRYLIAALQTLTPTIGTTTLALLASPQPPPLESLLTMLINDLSALAQPSVLVLDDYQVITTPAIHQAVELLIDDLPPQLHLVIATREDPPLPLARLRAHGQLVEIRADDLRLSPDEAAMFLADVMDLALSPSDVATLTARTEGWIIGLQLAALAMREHADRESFLASFAGSHRFVVDYLMEEVISRLPAHLQAFVLQTAILDQLCGPLCDAVLGLEASDVRLDEAISTSLKLQGSSLTLEELERRNLFLVPLDEQRVWYRYHQLFRDALRQRLASSAPPHTLATLHRRASQWFAQHAATGGSAYAEAAVRHALATADDAYAAALIEQHAPALVRRGEALTVQGWLAQLPHSLLAIRPRLALINAWILGLIGQLDAAEQLLEQAVSGNTAAPAQDAVVEADLLRVMIARWRGDPVRALELAQRTLPQIAPDNLPLHALATYVLGVAALDHADDTTARQLLTEVATLPVAEALQMTLCTLSRLSVLSLHRGQLSQALRVCDQAAHFIASEHDLSPLRGLTYLARGEVLCERNELDAAQQQLTIGLELLQRSADHYMLVRGAVALARVQQAQGQIAAALATFDYAETWLAQRHIQSPLSHICLAAHRTRLWLRQGNLDAAGRWVQAYEEATNGALESLQQLTRVRVDLAVVQRAAPEAALQHAATLLEQQEALAALRGWQGDLIEIRLLQALVYQAQGEQPRALAALSQALSLAEPEGYIRLFADEGVPMHALLRAADQMLRRDPAAYPALRTYVRRLLNVLAPAVAAHAESAEHSTPSPILIEPLTDREQAVLQLLIAGRSNQEIAQELVVASGTVKRHVSAILRKLHVVSRLAAVARARDLGLMS